MSDETGDRGDRGDAGDRVDAMSNDTSATSDTSATDSTADAPWESPYRITTEAWAQAARDLGVDLDAVRSTATHGRSRPALRLVRPNHSNSPTDLDALTLRTPWALALQAVGRLGPAVGEGRYAVWCLNDAAHSTPRGSLDAVDSSCVLLPPDPAGGHGALLTCAHAHCEHLQADDWLGMLVRDFGEEVWTEAVAEAARQEKGQKETQEEGQKTGAAGDTSSTTSTVDRSWEGLLVRQGRNPKPTFGNLCKILRHAPEFSGKLRRNLMTQGVEFEASAMPEERVGRIRERMEDAPWGGFSPEKGTLFDALYTVAAERSYHPVREYLDALTWDGEERIRHLAARVLRIPESQRDPLVATMLRKWLIATVRRAYYPGIKFDDALVLIGDQGLRKSTFFAILGGEWFGDTEIKIGDKDGLQQIHANWITEWGEIDRITSAAHAGAVKAFVSRRADDFRPPYARNVERFKRSCVIVGSTNNTQFLTDPTGARRFWCITVVDTINLDLLAEWRDQLWAEAVWLSKTDETHYLEGDDALAHAETVKRHRVRDAWEDIVERWIAEKWPGLRAASRRAHLQSVDVILGALELKPKDCTKGTEMRVGEVMRALGYTSKRVRLKQHEQPLYRDATGAVKLTVHAWVNTSILTTPELRAANEIEMCEDADRSPPASDRSPASEVDDDANS